MIILTIFASTNKVQAVQNSILSNDVEGKIVQLKKDEAKSLEDYKQK